MTDMMPEDELIHLAAQAVCRRNGHRYFEGYDEHTVWRDYQDCRRSTKTGRRCTKPRVFWPEGIGAPDPRACLIHLSDAERALIREHHDAVLARTGDGPDPACWDWPHPEICTFAGPDAALEFLQWWNKVCAVCGDDEELVLDHSHETAMIRGYICRRCNRSETYGDDAGIFGKYRQRSPAIILGIVMRYRTWGGTEAMPALQVPDGAPLRDAVDRISGTLW